MQCIMSTFLMGGSYRYVTHLTSFSSLSLPHWLIINYHFIYCGQSCHFNFHHWELFHLPLMSLWNNSIVVWGLFFSEQFVIFWHREPLFPRRIFATHLDSDISLRSLCPFHKIEKPRCGCLVSVLLAFWPSQLTE